MSSGIDIGSGGAISVDPDALREVAARMAGLLGDLGDASEAVRVAHRIIVETPGLSGEIDTVALWASGDAAEQMRVECEKAVTGTRLMADVYEYTDLRAEADALALHDRAAADAMYLRLEELEKSTPRIADLSAMLVMAWQDRRFEGLGNQFLPGQLGLLFGAAGFVGANVGLGKVWPGRLLTGTGGRVQICPVKTSSPTGAPLDIPDAFLRMPQTPGAQVAVEKYTMADDSTKYVVYLKGTQSVGSGGAEPWDMKSNVELYTGEMSASYQATLDALDAAGARPGDEVDVVAHSQSGMIAAYLSMESEFDVQVQITAGSPVEPTLDDDQILVQFRHTDDVVNSLAGGGSAGATGAPGSFTVTRVGDPIAGPQDLLLNTHMLESYIETAELAEESGDPRVESLGSFWADLNKAVEIERTEYHAERDE